MFLDIFKKLKEKGSRKETRTELEIGRARRRFALIFLAAIVVTAGAISFFVTQMAVKNMSTKIVNLIGVNNKQQGLNVDAYLKDIEDTAALMFSDDELCEYDATDDSIEEFTKIQRENAIQDRIHDLGVLDNFTDFGVVYSNDKTVGWLSNTTTQNFPDGGIYDYFIAHITDEKTQSGWFFDYETSYDRLYYVKKLNENAVIVTAFYSRELSSAFSLSHEMENMNVCMINDDDIVMYSNESKNIGNCIDVSLPEGSDGIGYKDDDSSYVVSMVRCENGWRVVSYISESAIFNEERHLINYSIIATLVLAVLVVLVGSLALKRIYNPVSGVLEDLKTRAELDQLTGLMNKASFGDVVKSYLEASEGGVVHVFLMMDMDNFKKVNDTLGHAEGDIVLADTAVLFKTVFGVDSLVGRVGGDEFAVYRQFNGWTIDNVRKKLEFEMKLMMDNFDSEIAERYKECKLSLSAGLYVASHGDMDGFDSSMKKADKALYDSKRSGKRQYKWFA